MLRQKSQTGTQSRGSMYGRRATMQRVIIKQGYLKKLPNTNKLGSSFKGGKRRWFVFGVMDGDTPYIEYYESEEGIFTEPPINTILLGNCKHLHRERSSADSKHPNAFSLILTDRVLTLVAPNRTTMMDWCYALQNKLVSLGVIESKNDSGKNDYERNPFSKPQPERNATSELPPTPDDVQDNSMNESLTHATAARQLFPGDDGQAPQDDYGTVWHQGNTSISSEQNGDTGLLVDVPPPLPERMNSRSDSRSLTVGATPPPAVVQPGTPHSDNYPFSFAGPLTPQTPQTPTTPGSASILTPKMIEAFGLSGGEEQVHGWDMPPGEEFAPPCYAPRPVLDKGAYKNLKQVQVEKLRHEIGNTSGIKLTLKRADCHHAIALLDCCDGVWIGGWNQGARPFLGNVLHIGDRLISVNGQVIESASVAERLIKHCAETDKITLIVQRTPHAKPYAFQRTVNGENIGFLRQDGTAEIVYVDPNGIAARQGMPSKATTLDGTNICHWWVTEINSRPLNLFFKGDEIETRLNAVGLDISVMIQPMDVIMELKKQLKTIKNYKDFLVQ